METDSQPAAPSALAVAPCSVFLRRDPALLDPTAPAAERELALKAETKEAWRAWRRVDAELDNLKNAVREYLSEPSCDGRPIRRQMRERLLLLAAPNIADEGRAKRVPSGRWLGASSSDSRKL